MAKKTNPFALFQLNQQPKKVTIDGLDQPIYVRRLSIAEIRKAVDLAREKSKGIDADDQLAYITAIFIVGVCDENGTPYGTLDDYDLVCDTVDPQLLGRAAEHVMSFNNMDKSVDDAEKN